MRHYLAAAILFCQFSWAQTTSYIYSAGSSNKVVEAAFTDTRNCSQVSICHDYYFTYLIVENQGKTKPVLAKIDASNGNVVWSYALVNPDGHSDLEKPVIIYYEGKLYTSHMTLLKGVKRISVFHVFDTNGNLQKTFTLSNSDGGTFAVNDFSVYTLEGVGDFMTTAGYSSPLSSDDRYDPRLATLVTIELNTDVIWCQEGFQGGLKNQKYFNTFNGIDVNSAGEFVFTGSLEGDYISGSTQSHRDLAVGVGDVTCLHEVRPIQSDVDFGTGIARTNAMLGTDVIFHDNSLDVSILYTEESRHGENILDMDKGLVSFLAHTGFDRDNITINYRPTSIQFNDAGSFTTFGFDSEFSPSNDIYHYLMNYDAANEPLDRFRFSEISNPVVYPPVGLRTHHFYPQRLRFDPSDNRMTSLSIINGNAGLFKFDKVINGQNDGLCHVEKKPHDKPIATHTKLAQVPRTMLNTAFKELPRLEHDDFPLIIKDCSADRSELRVVDHPKNNPEHLPVFIKGENFDLVIDELSDSEIAFKEFQVYSLTGSLLEKGSFQLLSDKDMNHFSVPVIVKVLPVQKEEQARTYWIY